MKKFSLEDALAGKPVVTKKGVPVTELRLFKDAKTQYCLAGILEGDINTWTKEGDYLKNNPSCHNLFMAPETVERWVNVYENDSVYEEMYHSKQDALDAKSETLNDQKYIGTFPITITI